MLAITAYANSADLTTEPPVTSFDDNIVNGVVRTRAPGMAVPNQQQRTLDVDAGPGVDEGLYGMYGS